MAGKDGPIDVENTKIILIFYDRISLGQRRGLGYASYRLARLLEDADRLAQVICLSCEPDVDLPAGKVHPLLNDPRSGLAFSSLTRLGKYLPGLKLRGMQEKVFDRFACRVMTPGPDRLLFCSRPLFPAAAARAHGSGMPVWVQSSVPHPLLNFALVRNEEIRLGLATRGAYTDLARAVRLSTTIAEADRVVTISRKTGAFTYRSYGEFVEPGRLLSLDEYFSIDPAEFDPIVAARASAAPKPEMVFLHVSHMNLIKGIPYLLEAWRLFKDAPGSAGKLVLAGRIDENVLRLIKERFRGLPDVEYAGYVPDLGDQFRGADVFLSPSISDAGPATILEAMAAGLPVVSSRNCGFASLIEEGLTGFTYPYNDPLALAGILERMVRDPAGTRQMGRQARKRLENLSIGRFGEELLRHLDDLDTARRRDPGKVSS